LVDHPARFVEHGPFDTVGECGVSYVNTLGVEQCVEVRILDPLSQAERTERSDDDVFRTLRGQQGAKVGIRHRWVYGFADESSDHFLGNDSAEVGQSSHFEDCFGIMGPLRF
jgi:hypothetical protein